MGLDVTLTARRPTEVYWAHISHGLRWIAIEADLYQVLWRPGDLGYSKVHELIVILEQGLDRLVLKSYLCFHAYNIHLL